MNRIKNIIVFFLLILFSCNIVVGQATLTASCRYSKVPLNSQFQVSFTLKGGTATKFTKPSFKNFSEVGSYQSSGGGMTVIVNGKVIQGGDEEESFNYTLVATTVGKFTIDAAKAMVNGKWIESGTLTIEVTNSGNATASNNSGNTSKGAASKNTAPSTNTTDGSNSDIFIKAFIDKTNPYVGEQVIVTYKLYTKIPVTQYGIDKLPAFSGFWSQDLNNEKDKPVQYKDGQYVVAEVRKVALFPQKSGALKIDPLNLECIVQVQTQQKNDPFASFFNDPFFGNMGSSFFNTVSEVKKTLISNPLSLYVKPLPVANQPAEFSGSVGKFNVEATIDKTSAKTNDAINLIYKVTGIGNISLIDKPKFDFPADLETYDPDIKENVIRSAAGVSGTKTFSYLIIPRNAGDFTIKPVEFSYFDLATNSYVTLTSPEFKLNIAKGKGDDKATVTSANKEDIKYLNSDIRYIKNNNVLLSQIGSCFYGSPLFFFFLLLPILLFVLFVIIYRKKLKENSNIALVRNKKATGVARKRLKAASVFLQENKKEPFLDEVFKALWGYVSDKLGIPISELSKETVNEKFNQKNVHEDIAQQFINTLNNCEYARFAPDDGTLTMDNIYNEAIDIITKMEKELK